jgi:hypothetical protein
MGSPHAVIFFSQIFYWQDKAHAEEGVHKTREAIESETGLTFDQQATARKQLVSRGILKETHKRLEHKVYFLVDCDRLDEIINENNELSRNGKTRFREEGKADFGKQEKPSPRTRENPRRESGKSHFDPTEITSELLQRIQTLAHRLKPLHRLVLQNRIIPLNSKQPGRPTPNALVAIPSPGLSKPGKPA